MQVHKLHTIHHGKSTKEAFCLKKFIAALVALMLCLSLCVPAYADNDWTIFVYICGADLESNAGLASENMKEMVEASASSGVRFIVETGGASAWSNEASPDELDRFEIVGGTSTIVDRQPQASMGESQTLSDFLSWGLAAYPSAHVGLVFWDHGGGSITGVCFDELYESQSLTLRAIDDALNNTKDALPGGFDFIGYDACLMGTLENANMLVPHARYMIGSQECEPGTGWDYKSIGTTLAANPAADMIELGKAICDGFYENCAADDQSEGATLALIDLSKIGALCSAFELYAEHLYDATDNEANFAPICRAIDSAENFGGNNRNEGYTNMVDLGGLVDAGAQWSSSAQPVREAENAAVLYQVRGANHPQASGLSIYYPLQVQGSKELSYFRDVAVSTHYLALVNKIAYGFANGGSWDGYDPDTPWDFDSMVPDFTQSTAITFQEEPVVDENDVYYFVLSDKGLNNTVSVDAMVYMYADDGQNVLSLGTTSDVLADWDTGRVEDDFDGYWFSLPDGQNLSISLVSEGDDYDLFTSPVTVNDDLTNLRFAWYHDTGEVKLMDLWDGIGSNGIAARPGQSLKTGDRVVPVCDAVDTDTFESSKFTGEEYVWSDGDTLGFGPLPDGDYLYAFCINDIFGGSYATPNARFTINQGNIAFNAA